MKNFALAAVLATTASTAFAGNVAAPVIEVAPAVIIEETAAASSSSAGLIIPLILIALVAAALAD